MAKARMLHNKISKSLQVDNLSLPAQLLFSWMISWADDEGRIRGEPKYIKGTVVPLKNWSLKHVREYIESMRDQGLIYYWSGINEQYIEFVKWEEHQQIRKDRLVKSLLPSYKKNNDNQASTKMQPDDNQETAEANISESNPIEFNKSESNGVQLIADKNLSYKEPGVRGGNNYPTSGEKPTANNSFLKRGLDPHSFEPQNEGEYAAKEVWSQTEPNNPSAFYTMYLPKIRKGLPPSKLYEFGSEIKQDPSIENPGAVMNKKISDYFNGKETEVTK